MNSARRRTLLFYRDYQGPSGGNLKVWDYYCHALHSASFCPAVHLTPASYRIAENPWAALNPPPMATWSPCDADALFLAGLDWLSVPESIDIPVINLIQGVRHADPGDPRRDFLARPATRVCVSHEVASAIRQTGIVNGPVHVIPNGVDVRAAASAAPDRDIPVLIAGAKNPAFAARLAAHLDLAGISSVCVSEMRPREEFLSLLARAAVAVTLPSEREGCFLPALEAMMLGAIVICPDCIGNRSFCRHGDTAIMPPYEIAAMAEAVRCALEMCPSEADRMRVAASAITARHSLEVERNGFLAILEAL